MRSFSRFAAVLAGAIASLAVASAAFGQAYPTTNPSYVPNAVKAPAVLAVGASDTVFTLQSRAKVSLRISGTCTALAAVTQVTNDGVTWTTVPQIAVSDGTTSTSAISAVGFWRVDTSAMTAFRLHVTALTGTTCSVSLAG